MEKIADTRRVHGDGSGRLHLEAGDSKDLKLITVATDTSNNAVSLPSSRSDLKPPKLCVFCGKRPESKTKEHVIPLWLIKLTGDPNRQAIFDVDWSKNPPAPRRFAFDQFTFPACNDCDCHFADVEKRVEAVISSLLSGHELTELDFDLLLTWLDKVRVGLWLAKYILEGNPPRNYAKLLHNQEVI